MPSRRSQIRIVGDVSPGFEVVRDQFARYFDDGVEENAQVCVYLNGDRVVDLAGTSVGRFNYDQDSLQVAFSSTKSVTAICFARLVDAGLLDYQDKVIQHWPEFNQDGSKGEIRICDVLRHESGLAHLDHIFTFEDVQRDNIKTKNSIGKVIEIHPANFPPDEFETRRSYHAISRGWILNEIFRRVDPKSRTIGEVLREEVAGPLNADVFIGATDEEADRAIPISSFSKSYLYRHLMMPRFFGSRVNISVMSSMKLMKDFRRTSKVIGSSDFMKPKPVIQGMAQDISRIAEAIGHREVIKGECPSASGLCSARGLARLGACILNNGTLDGVTILKPETIEDMHRDFKVAKDATLGLAKTEFSQGGLNLYREGKFEGENKLMSDLLRKNRGGFVGWLGYGGSIFQWHPRLGISFAYIPTKMSWFDGSSSKAGNLQKLVVDCVQRKKASDT